MTVLACLDLESTGLDVEKDRIVEIALVVWDTEANAGRGGEKLAFCKRVNPGVHIPAKVVEVHGITDADVVREPPFSAIAGSVAVLLGKLDLLVGHNIERFDCPLLIHELVRAKVSPPRFPEVFDTLLAGRICTDEGRIPNLGELCWALDVDYDPAKAHGALYDVRCTLSCFLRGVELGYWALPEMSAVGVAA